jgi:hypothetical protein
MTGVFGRGRRSRRATRVLLRGAALSVALGFVLAGCTSGDEVSDGSGGTAAGNVDLPTCGAEVEQIPEPSRQINLVLDESGSMFVDIDGSPLTLWSIAKYSLEVFAALIGPQDTLNVYRMSDYGQNASSAPTLTISGDESAGARVAQVHDLELQGGSTPWRSVTAAAENLTQSGADETWLVILTDGQFRDGPLDIPPTEVIDLLANVEAADASVAFMSIGGEATVIPSGDRRTVAKVATGAELVPAMTGFSNVIFERSVAIVNGQTQEWSPDVPMQEVVLFAQGQNVSVGSASAPNGSINPDDQVAVSWSENGPIEVVINGEEVKVEAVADESLEGVIATFRNISPGPVTFDVANASQVDLFYKPALEFGYTVVNADGQDIGNVLNADEPFAINYGFMDSNCVIVNSELLNPVSYSAQVLDGEETVIPDLAPGQELDLPPGNYTMVMDAVYNGGTAAATIPLIVGTAVGSLEIPVSQMSEFPPLADGIRITYTIIEPNGLDRAPTREEWAAFQPEQARVESTGNEEFELIKGDRPGDLTLLVRAPGGDIYSADTGQVAVTVYPPEEQGRPASLTITVIDDLTSSQRFWHWFWTTGIWLVIGVILLIILAGYIFKRRFHRQLSKSPQIDGIPRGIGMTPLTARGRFKKNGVRRFLPFVADKAMLVYTPPGVMGFLPLKLKAGPQKSMVITNLSQISQRNNVQINGMALEPDMVTTPRLAKGSVITADTPQMSYEVML